jgi:hypothetical protein
VAALAEALWTRIEGFQVLVETLEEMLQRMLECHGAGGAGAAPSFASILKSRKQRLRNRAEAERNGREIPGCARHGTPEDLQSGDSGRSAAMAEVGTAEAGTSAACTGGAAGEPRGEVEARDEDSPAEAEGIVSLDDLWTSAEPFPGSTPRDGLRQWFEAADGVLSAGWRLAQRVDVALYEFCSAALRRPARVCGLAPGPELASALGARRPSGVGCSGDDRGWQGAAQAERRGGSGIGRLTH